MTEGEELLWKNAAGVLRDINMRHLDLAHGAAVTIVKRSLNVRDRPTHYQQEFLERECPALLAYLEKLSASGDAAGWRALRGRIQLHAEVLLETGMQPCASPWKAAIWHTLPEIVALGQYILDRRAEKNSPAPGAVPTAETTDGKSGDGGKGGSAGATAKPRPSSRLALPAVQAKLTDGERKALDRADAEEDDPKKELLEVPDGTDGDGGPGGMGGPKGPGGPK